VDDQNELQLSFDVGGVAPNVASVRVSGSLALGRELRKGEMIGLQITDADGMLLAQAYGRVVDVGFKDKLDAHGEIVSCARRHVVKMD
jgi:hypothetical protein